MTMLERVIFHESALPRQSHVHRLYPDEEIGEGCQLFVVEGFGGTRLRLHRRGEDAGEISMRTSTPLRLL